jgi:hypothetical protein
VDPARRETHMHQTAASAFTTATAAAYAVETLRFGDVAARPVDMPDGDPVIAPLIGDGCDAVDLVDWLGRLAVRGRIRGMTRPLQDRALVPPELCALADPPWDHCRALRSLRPGRVVPAGPGMRADRRLAARRNSA